MGQLSGLSFLEGTVLCTLFTWGMTALGAACVFGFQKAEGKWMDLFMGFGAGVMLAASFWSLLAPAIEMSGGWFLPACGFVCGGFFILLAEYWLDLSGVLEKNPGKKRSLLLILAVTLHNIPEGMAIGVSFAGSTGIGPWLLALGIGLQNVPEGAAVSLPLKREGLSGKRSFFCGQISGLVEPIAAVAAYFLTIYLGNILPFLLAFSAGSMLAVVSGELLPEAASANKLPTVSGLILGFLLMMVLDVALG